VPDDELCVLQFVEETTGLESAGAEFDSTVIYKGKGKYDVWVNFTCVGGSQRAAIFFDGGNAKTCGVSRNGSACYVPPGGYPANQDYNGKKKKDALQALRDYMDCMGY
jgi:hypothetical protein